MEYIGKRKLIFGATIFLILVSLLMGSYIFLSPKKASPNNQKPVASVSADLKPTIPSPPKFSSKQQVIVGSQGFEPSTIRVKVNTMVNWVNQSGKDVALVSNPVETHDAYPPLNQGVFPDGSGVSVIFDMPGTYGYHNFLNPKQIGTVIVE